MDVNIETIDAGFSIKKERSEQAGAPDAAALLRAYDRYIQQANDEDRFASGWRPVCVAEFAECDYQFYKDDGQSGSAKDAPFTPADALALTYAAADAKKLDRYVREAREAVENAARKGERRAAMPVWKGPEYEALAKRLSDEGWRIEWKRERNFGVLQDPYPFICW